MELYLIFAALLQSALITVTLGTKISWRNIPAVLMVALMFNYTLVLLNVFCQFHLSILHLPIGFAMGPLLYFFVRFSFLPSQNLRSQRWLLWFVPFAMVASGAMIYWMLRLCGSGWAEQLGRVIKSFARYDFYHFLAFFIATIVFLIRNNTKIGMNIMYREQLKWIKYFVLFIALFVWDELFSDPNSLFFTGLFGCAFTNTIIYLLLGNAQVFSKEKSDEKEWIKLALSEQQKAVVITNRERITEYVNEPFLEMTGYRRRDVVGRKPSFLQGALTSAQSVDFVRQKLAEEVPFEAEIINYRKSGEAYICRIAINPIFNNGELTHFIAYEEDIETIAEAMPTDDEITIFEQLKTYFEKEEPFRNTQLQAADVADYLGISARQLGEILKKCDNQSISDFIKQYRIRAAIKMLNTSDYEHLTIEAIGQSCGFNSKNTFHAAFKKETGKTPKMFLEVA